jgi:multiple sugar transport system ATP-binding protein
MARVVFDHVTKEFGSRRVVDALELEVADGEFLVVVGPSGCGKTTTLRMLAGLEAATSGVIYIGGRAVNSVLAKDRGIGMVFQNYALFPHMTIENNLLFGLRTRHVARSDARRQVEEIAALLGVSELLGQKPGQLSGGERQRVALGRALLRRPSVFLLDEPLSNLDAALRTQMRFELKRIHKQFPVTTVYVTHDQVEAMTMADRIALMCDGRLQQVDVPSAMYSRPTNIFVGGFIGSPKMNLLPATVGAGDRGQDIDMLGTRFRREWPRSAGAMVTSGGGFAVGFRSEDVKLSEARPGTAPSLEGAVEVVEPLGADTYVTVRVGEHLVRARCGPTTDLELGARVYLEINVAKMHLFDPEGIVVAPPVLETVGSSVSAPGP